MRVELRRWSDEDLPVLERANTPEMTTYLGSPETAEQLRERQARYLRHNATGESCMLRIDVDGVPVGSIGYWPAEHEGVPAFEAGWSVEPQWQGRGVATEALRQLIRRVADDGRRGAARRVPGDGSCRVERAVPRRRVRARRHGDRALARRCAHLQHVGARHVTPRPERPRTRRR